MYQFKDVAAVSGGGSAALSFDAAQSQPFVARAPERLQSTTPRLELLQDLGTGIGSAQWFRGLATCTALCLAAFSFAPGIEPLVGASPRPYTEAQFEEARALSFSPLAYGADTGRRMAATDAVQPLTDTPERPRIALTATLGRGDSFARVLRRAGVSKDDAAQLEIMIGEAVDMTAIKAGTPLELVLGRRPAATAPRPVESLAFRARFDLSLSIERRGGALVLNRVPIAVDDTPLRIQGQVGSSLYRAARAAGAPAKAIETYLRAIATQVSVGSLGANDRFDIIVEHRRAATGEVEVGRLLYAGLDRSNGKDLQLMQWTQGGSTQWFEASGVGKTSGSLQRPVPGAVSSNFGKRRHPILGYTRMHKGMDFRAGYGTPILAATDGRVTRAGWAGGYGKQVRIAHAGGLTTSYSHMSRITAKPGQRVRQGQVIGYVGSTGLSTGPHLHYELYRNGTAINPASFKFTTRAQLSGSDLARFKSQLRSLLAVPTSGAKAERTAETKTATRPQA